MSAPTALFDALRGLFADRVYPGTFPQPPKRPVWPACRYALVGGRAYVDQCGQDGGDTDDDSYQIDVVALSFDEMRVLVRQVRLALQAVDPPCVVDGTRYLFEAETETHRTIIDCTFYPSSSDDSPA